MRGAICYTDHASLGSGTFAEVRKAVDVETGDLRAIKVSQVSRSMLWPHEMGTDDG